MSAGKSDFQTRPGHPLPFGSTLLNGACRFSVFSRNATAVSLLLYERPGDPAPAREIKLDPRLNRTGDIWHVEVQGVRQGQLYLWRVDGPRDPAAGHRFDPDRLLIDPGAKALTGEFGWKSDNDIGTVRCVVVNNDFDWDDDRQPRIPLRDSVIYETHVRGFTRHGSSGVASPGTFEGLVEKIDYFKSLGITAVELLPVHEFNENELVLDNPLNGQRLRNFWGYSTVGFFAPNGRYSAGDTALGEQVTGFKRMVRAFHQAGLEVILDVVFNHTAEGDETGPTISFRGLDNRIYYLLREDGRYFNFSGCGNTVNCNHPVVRSFIRNCLRYWVVEMHVDGFRFDLASILGRDTKGCLIENPPLLESIAEDPILRHVKIIAEAWDAAGAYQVGSFHGERWSEWNGRFRDDVRRFWRGEALSRNGLATRITGSSDLYSASGKLPRNSINFITAHDGFTLYDLVSYSRKHNRMNGEGDRDGEGNNLCLNFGPEGPSADPELERMRLRLVRSCLATLLLSQGVPMLLAGDELGRTQHGNNNAWCQDNEISWIDWGLLGKNGHLQRFTCSLVALRRGHGVFRRNSFFEGRDHNGDGRADVEWYEPDGRPLCWGEDRPALACFLSGAAEETGRAEADCDFLLLFNAGRSDCYFALPPSANGEPWRRVLDSADESEGCICGPGQERPLLEDQSVYTARGRSVVLLSAG
ncbi:glycogen debranching protein GlgX [bacterium]|nr:glycogen debranching protein GlgX [bacterium]